MTTKHTPGPWKHLDGLAYGSRDVYGYRGAHVAQVWNGGTRSPEVATANAHLIAAAPGMLVALELAAERLEISNYEGEEDPHLVTIRAAIAAAKGGDA